MIEDDFSGMIEREIERSQEDIDLGFGEEDPEEQRRKLTDFVKRAIADRRRKYRALGLPEPDLDTEYLQTLPIDFGALGLGVAPPPSPLSGRSGSATPSPDAQTKIMTEAQATANASQRGYRSVEEYKRDLQQQAQSAGITVIFQ